MTRAIPYVHALGEALAEEMRRDPTVVLFGEDSVGGKGGTGTLGHAWGPTKGLHEEFPDRILDAPITEAAFVGAAVGAAATGLRPVADLLFVDFAGVAFDQLLNQAAKLRYMTGGKAKVPAVIRTLYGAGMRRGAQHSQVNYSQFVHIPGLKVVAPTNPYDAKGLMVSAIRDDDPVIFFEAKSLFFIPGPVPEDPYTVPLGEAAITRSGTDCTIVAIGSMVPAAQGAADALAEEGISCEIVDPRTLSPLDTDTIFESVHRTGHLVVVDEDNPRCSVASDIAAQVAQGAFDALQGPIQTVTSPHAPTPFSPVLEDAYMPNSAAVVEAVQSALGDRQPA